MEEVRSLDLYGAAYLPEPKWVPLDVTDLLIKEPGKELRWAKILEPFWPFVDVGLKVDNPDGMYVYLTVTQTIVERGKSQRYGIAHTDGWGDPDSITYSACWGEPTEFWIGTFRVRKSPHRKEIFRQLEGQASRMPPQRAQEGVVYRYDSSLVHRSPKASMTHLRTFLRLCLSTVKYA